MLKTVLAKIVRHVPIYKEILQARDSLNDMRNTVRVMHNTVHELRKMEAMYRCDLELRLNPRYGEPRRLQRHAFQVNSQNGEDGIIHEIFRRIGTRDRVFAEVGVGNGVQNNTAFLLSQGWEGFWIDGNGAFLHAISARKDLQGGCLKSLVSFVTKENVAGSFGQLGVPKEFDLLSLDIDQNTFYIWEALYEFTPRAVVVEYNAVIPPDIDWKVQYAGDRAWDGTQNFGASLKAFEMLGNRLGYSLVGCDIIGSNAFFVRRDLVGDKFAEPFTAENHYEPPRYAYCYRRGHGGVILDRG
jgi:hypothetical protein